MSEYDYRTDPGFLGAPAATKHAYLKTVDPQYRDASPEEQTAYLSALEGRAPSIRQEPSFARKVLQGVVRMGPPAAGLGIGSLSGNPAMAGLGYAMGEGVSRAAAPLVNPNAVAPEWSNLPKNAVWDTALGTLFSQLPTTVGNVGKEAASRVKGLLGVAGPPTTEDVAVREAAQRLAARYGLEQPLLTAAGASGSPQASFLERIPRMFTLGYQAGEPLAKSVTEGFRTASRGLGKDVGAPLGQEAAGTLVQAGTKATELKARGQAADLYRTAYQGREDLTLPVPILSKTAEAMAALEDKLRGVVRAPIQRTAKGLGGPEAPKDGDLQEILAVLDPARLPADVVRQYRLGGSAERSLQEVTAIEQRLGALARSTSNDYNRKQFLDLQRAVQQDLSEFARKNPGFGQQYQAAKDFYRDVVAPRFSEEGTLRPLQESLAEKVLPQMLRSPQTFRDAYTAAQPEGQAAVRAALFTRVLKETEQNGMAGFLKAKNKIPQEVWDQVFTGNPAQALQDLTAVAERTRAFRGVFTDPTAHAWLGAHSILAAGSGITLAALGHPYAGVAASLATLLSPNAFGKLVYSKVGQRFLTSQPPPATGPSTPGPLGALLRGGLGAAASVTDQSEK